MTRKITSRHAAIMEASGFWVDAKNGNAQFHKDRGRKGTWLGKIRVSSGGMHYLCELIRIGPDSDLFEATLPTTCSDRQLVALCTLFTPEGN